MRILYVFDWVPLELVGACVHFTGIVVSLLSISRPSMYLNGVH